MAEVALCVGLYTAVLFVEFSPIVFRRLNWHGLAQLVTRFYIVFVIAGVILSTLHQSSLGALYLLAPTKLHPLWYSELLPYEFLITAIAAGLAMLIIEATFFTPDPKSPTRRRSIPQLGEYAAVLLLTYLTVRLADIWVHNRLALKADLETAFFLVEIIAGVALPAVLFLMPTVQHRPRGPFWAACLVAFGVLFNRGNVAVTALIAHTGEVYFPSFWEIAITLAFVATEIALFIWIMRKLVLPLEEQEHRAALATGQA
jgi:Ni/Fe-hydrogenase subunit HybB-like protein